jgi:hypothetical protein
MIFTGRSGVDGNAAGAENRPDDANASAATATKRRRREGLREDRIYGNTDWIYWCGFNNHKEAQEAQNGLVFSCAFCASLWLFYLLVFIEQKETKRTKNTFSYYGLLGVLRFLLFKIIGRFYHDQRTVPLTVWRVRWLANSKS